MDDLDYFENETDVINEFLVTNFNKEKRSKYEKAIETLGKGNLYIREKAYWNNGHLDNNMNALMCIYHEDLTNFWDIFENLEYAKYKRKNEV